MILVAKNRDFGALWMAEVLSQCGLRMAQIGLLWWLVSRNAGSEGRWAAAFLLSGALPAVLGVKAIAMIVDRFSAKRVLASAESAAAAVLCALAFSLMRDALSEWILLGCGFLLASCQAIINPSLNKAIKQVVSEEDVPSAVAFVAATESMANFGGAVAGALLIEVIGVLGAVTVSAVGYALSASCNATIRYRYGIAARSDELAARAEESSSSFRPILKKLLLMFGLVNFFGTPLLVVLPLYTRLSLGEGARTLSALEAALWGGLLAGSALSRKVFSRRRPIRSGALCLLAFGAAILVPGFWVSREAYLAALVLAGAAMGINNVGFLSLFQAIVEDRAKGRFFAELQGWVGFTFPVAFFVFGALVDAIGPPRVLLVQGAGVMLLAAFGFGSLIPREREL